MNSLNFAKCIVFPGVTASDIVAAAIRYNVHILDKETFDPKKDYRLFEDEEVMIEGVTIVQLFLFPHDAILVNNRNELQHVLETIERQYL